MSGPTWRKSSYSNGGTNCVEIAALQGDLVALRNSRDPEGAQLIFDRRAIGAMLAGAKGGEFDDLA